MPNLEPRPIHRVVLLMSKIQYPKSNGLDSASSLARAVSPEDLKSGQWVAVLWVSYEFPSFLWVGADQYTLPPAEVVKIAFKPCASDNSPIKIREICLPFLVGERVNGQVACIDIRQVALCRVGEMYAKAYRKIARKSDRNVGRLFGSCSRCQKKRKKKRKKRRRK